MVDDIDARLARLRHAAYGPGATPGADELAELAELEHRRTGADAVTAGADDDTVASSAAIRVDPEVESAAEDVGARGAAAEPTGPRRATITRRRWAVAAASAVAIALIASVVGYTLGSHRPSDSAVAAASNARIDEAVGLPGWLGDTVEIMGWDPDSARLLGTVDDVSVVVVTKQDGAQWCGVLAQGGAYVAHTESCRRSGTGVVGLVLGGGPSVQVERIADGTFTFVRAAVEPSAS